MIEKAKRTEAALMTACGEAPLNTPKDRMVSIQWRDIVVNTAAGRRLLRGITGIAHPKEVVALMGASGAGKTTLLNTLLQRNLRGLNVKGTVLVNGRNIGQAVTTVSAYVQQEDLFVGTLTVREHLVLQARMRLPSNCKEEDRIARVNEVLRDMSLEGAQSSRIGIPGVLKGISGGERKRLAFASEILNNPPILFCDEPTTGLDSHMAMLIVRRLESLAATQGKTIICTIHQPSSETFELFDKVVFLAQGRVVFQGSPSESVIFFSKCGFTMPLHTNPADYYIDTLAISPDKVDECKKRCNEISDKFALSQYSYRVQEQMSIASYPRELYPHDGPNFLILLSSLVVRYLTDNMRNPAMLRAKFIQKVFMGIFLGLLYLNTPLNQDGLMSIQGVLFYYCSELTYSTIFGIQACMPGDFPMLIREYHDGVYPVSAYYLGKIFSYLPIFTLDGMVMITISYFMIGLLPEPIHFAKTLITCMLVEWNVASLGIAICSISPSYAFAISVSGPILTVLSLTGGLFINTTEMPQWSNWIQYVSWFRYGFESLIINEFNDESKDNITCLGNAGTVMPNCVRNGAEVLEELHFSPENFYWNWMMLVLSTLAIFCFGYIGLVFRVKRLR